MGSQLAGSGCLARGEEWIEISARAESWPKIEKVPRILREVTKNTSCYDPQVVSIGPYHHGNPALDFMQQHKETMARQYAIGELIQKVSPLVKDAKECYTYTEAVAKFSDEEFIQMMVLDACFVVEFIDCIVNGKPEALKIKENMTAFVRRDLLLLENQIPFKVLNQILGVKFRGEEKIKKLHEFFSKIRALPQEETNKKTIDGEPAHLLDIMRSNLVDKSSWKNNSQGKGKGKGKGKDNDWFSYRSAKELKAVGIHFRPNKTNNIFTDIRFHTSIFYYRAYLNLPQICIDDSTKSMLLNMVAHECSTYGPDDLGVSSYICFMDSLVDHAEDVMELRKRGILLNFLGSDQQVADLFNDISDNLVAHTHAYETVKEGIEEHYKNRVKIWLAEWLHTHFSSPWTILAFAGALLALVLSVIQTFELFKSSNSCSCSCEGNT